VLRRAFERRLVHALPSLKVEFPDGRAFLLTDRVYRSVFVVGDYEPETGAAMQRFATSGSFVIDAGANHGWLSLLMARTVGPAGTVWAFEPTPPVLEGLRKNLALNPGLEVEVFELALGDEPGEVDVHVFDDLPLAHASTSSLGRGDYHLFRVPVVPLDDLRLRMPGPLALIKVDVEGAELGVLRGARETLAAADRAVVLLEVNYETSGAFGYRPVDLLAELARHRAYQVFRAEAWGLSPERDPARAPHGATWVCVPPALATTSPAGAER
jgi:FkbM family methyltransferase